MNEPQVFVLTLRVDDWVSQVIRWVMAELGVSFRLTDLNVPAGPRAPDGLPEWRGSQEQIEHYLKVCRQVIFIVGDAGPAPDAVLQRLAGMVREREQRGGAVSGLKLGDDFPRTPEPQLPRHLTLRNAEPSSIARFLKNAVAAPPAGGDIKGVSPRGTTRGDADLLKKLRELGLDRGADKGADKGAKVDDAGDIPNKLPRDRTAFLDDIPPAPDEVFCSVYAPRLAAPSDEILVQAFAHLRGQEEVVAALSSAADPGAAKVGARRLSEQVAEGDRLGFHLTLRGAEIDAPDQEFVWAREPLAAQFGVYFPETAQPRDAVGTVTVTRGGVPVGHVKFTLRLVGRGEKAAAAPAAAERQGQYSRYHTAFVSYASKDRERVLPRVQALAAARIKVFQDFIDLEPGERWERGLYKHIDECDVFFLFWSQAAKESRWVREEAKYARARQEGRDDRPPEIIPIIIEGPPPVEPPPELNFIHFNDKFIYLLKGVEAEAEARRKGEA